MKQKGAVPSAESTQTAHSPNAFKDAPEYESRVSASNLVSKRRLGPGRLIGQTYHLERLIGKGGMGWVYQAQHIRTQGRVALKLIQTSLLASPRAVKRFELEARHTASIQHPHVVSVFDYGQDDDLLYLAMELCLGQNLKMLISEEGPLKWEEASAIAQQLLMALQATHESPKSLIHRDIKPTNILIFKLVNDLFSVKLVDFGISMATANRSAITLKDTIGSPHYMSPEQFMGETISPATDLYGLGCTIFTMLTGKPPFRGTTLELGKQHIMAEPPLDKLEGLASEPFIQWLTTLLRKAPDERPKSAAVALENLRTLPTKSAQRTVHTTGVLAAATYPSSSKVSPSLPRIASSFVGREHDLVRLDTCVKEDARLITVRGIGGLGKTRLVIEWAHQRTKQWEGGVVFCNLSEAFTLDEVIITVARVLGVQLSQDPTEQLGYALQAKGKVLIIFDNFEQIAKIAAVLLGPWQAAAPEALFIVTSRCSLGLKNETLFDIDPLALPTHTQDTDVAAVTLFMDRAKALAPNFEAKTEDLEHIVNLVRKLDGLPLAIELAATRVRSMRPKSIVTRLKKRFRLLRSSHQDVPARQSTLEATMDWSWGLLEPYQQAVLAQCAVFKGSFSLEAAETIIDLSKFDADIWVCDVLEQLVDSSFVRALPGSLERFVLFASVRAYAIKHLKSPSPELRQTIEKRATIERALVFFAAYGSATMLEQLACQHNTIQELCNELDNLRGMSRYALTQGKYEQAALCTLAVGSIFHTQGPYRNGLDAIQKVLPHTNALGATHIRLLLLAGRLEKELGNFKSMCDYSKKALTLAHNSGDVELKAHALLLHAHSFALLGQWDNIQPLLETALTLTQHLDLRLLKGHVLSKLGSCFALNHQTEKAQSFFQQGLLIAREFGDLRLEYEILDKTNIFWRTKSNKVEYLECFERIATLSKQLGDKRLQWQALMCKAKSLIDHQNYTEAQACYQTSLQLTRSTGNKTLEGFSHLGLSFAAHKQLASDASIAQSSIALKLGKQLKYPGLQLRALFHLFSAHYDKGMLSEARIYVTHELELSTVLGNEQDQLWAKYNMARLELEMGNAEKGLYIISSVAENLQDEKDTFKPFVLQVLAHAHLLTGSPQKAFDLLDTIAALDSNDSELLAKDLLLRTNIQLYRHRAAEALKTLESFDTHCLPLMQLEHAVLMAWACALDGQTERGRTHLATAQNTIAALDFPPQARLANIAKIAARILQ